jgi:glc operon protein GlcG
MKAIFGMSAMILALGVTVSAQPVAQKRGLTLEGARKVVAAAEAEARRVNAPGGAIAVVDEGGNPMLLERLDGTFAAGANISLGKARTAALFKKPTKAFEEIIKNGRTAMVALNDFTPLQGGVPIVVEGEIVGAIGVSGAANADQDSQIAEAGAAALGPKSASAEEALPVSYFDREQVVAAFSKGAVLFDDRGERNYQIHTSRREGPGMAEVHLRETDVIYVQNGGATFVTGGTVVEGNTTAPDEIRGASIRDGETRRLVKGDVIIVPKGTPHWFREVQAPFTYYVVKVRQ